MQPVELRVPAVPKGLGCLPLRAIDEVGLQTRKDQGATQPVPLPLGAVRGQDLSLKFESAYLGWTKREGKKKKTKHK